MNTEQTGWEAEEPKMRAHYSFKGGQRGRYVHLFSQEADTVRRSVTDVLAEAPGHLAFQTAEEIEAYLRGERDAWER